MNIGEYNEAKPALVSQSSLPHGYTKRPFIHNYYRLNHTFVDCFKSIFVLHNETVNIWSHIIGFFIWLHMYMQCAKSEAYTKADSLTQSIIQISYISCIFMPLFSSLYHTFNASTTCCYFSICYRQGGFSSPDTSTERGPFNLAERIFLRLDLLGILSLWFSRVLLEGHLVWWCERDAFTNLLLLSIAAFLIFSPIVLYNVNIKGFGPLFLIVHIPIVSMTISLLWTSYELSVLLYMCYSISGTICAFVAFYIYANKIPEVYKPGQYDLLGHSHNYWHFFTWLGPTLVLIGFDHMLNYRVLSGFQCK